MSYNIKDQQLENNILMVAETWGRNYKGSCQYSADRGYSCLFQGKIFNLSATHCQNFWMNRGKYSQSPRCSACRRPCTQLLRNSQVSWTQRQHIWKVCECACAYINFLREYIDVIWKQLLTPLVPNSKIKCVWSSLEEYLSVVHITCWSIGKI